MHRFLLALGLVATASCGSDGPGRTLGTLQASLTWEGDWPQEGVVLTALFEVPPWDPAFVPGPPQAYIQLQQPEGSELVFRFPAPGVPFGTYGGFMVAWQDPDAVESSKRMLPVSVFGTSLDDLSAAQPVVLSADQPDWVVELPQVTLYATGDDMRQNFKPVSSGRS